MRSRPSLRDRGVDRIACLSILVVALLVCVLPQVASAERFALSKVAQPTSGCGVCMAVPVPTVPAGSTDAVGPDFEGGGEKGGFDAKDLREAYKLPEAGGSSQTVAVIDAFNDPGAKSDLEEYRKKYKVYFKGTETACTEVNGCLKKIDQAGETEKEAEEHGKSFPVDEPDWRGEESLDLDMVSAACPECHILLVEANNEELANLSAANEEAVAKKATETSNSWGYVEASGYTADNKYFDHPGVPTFAAAGDVEYDGCAGEYKVGICYPAASPYVIAVGGTKLKKETEGSRKWGEEVWWEPLEKRGTGSGCSKYEPKPPYQQELPAKDSYCEHRLDNDVAADAAPESPVSVYNASEGGWVNYGGTSASTPFVAGVDAHATSATQLLGANAFYKKPSILFDTTKGKNGTCTPPLEDVYFCTAEEGYDGPTGEGTPDNVFTSVVPAGATGLATNVEAKGAKLNGIVNPNGATTKYHFEYGTTEAFGKATTEEAAGAGTSDLEEGQAVTGLAGGTKYYFRVVTTSSNGAIKGLTQSFTTVKTEPKAETKPPSGVTETSATLNGTVNPEGNETKYYFEYGATTSYGTKTAEASAGAGTGNVEVSKTIGGLAAGTEYHFRIVATNAEGTSYGADEAIKTRSWSLQETPNPKENNSASLDGISCLSTSACTAIGYFEKSEAHVVPLAESWNGTAWSLQEPPQLAEAKASYMSSVSCFSSTFCVAVGYFQKTAGSWKPYAERWNGTAWTAEELPTLTGGTYSYLEGVSCTSSEACTAVGLTFSSSKEVMLVDRWNGKTWSTEEPPMPAGIAKASLASISCSASSACTAIGSFKNSAGEPTPLAERWNGASWTAQEPPNPSGSKERFLKSVSCASATACAAVGYLENSAGEDAPFAEIWNGTSWSLQEVPSPKGVVKRSYRYLLLTGVSCTLSTECVAVGYYYNSAEHPTPYAEAWNGVEWAEQEAPKPAGAIEAQLSGVSCTGSLTCTGVGGDGGSTLAELYH
jgi:Subtilase family